MIHPACVQGTSPKLAGGPITDGNYVLASLSVYSGGASGTCTNTQDRRGAASFHAGALDLATDYDPLCKDPVTVDAKHRQTWKVSASGSTLSGPESCDTFGGGTTLSPGTSWSYDRLRGRTPERFHVSPAEYWEGFTPLLRRRSTPDARSPRVETTPASSVLTSDGRRQKGERRIVVDGVAYCRRALCSAEF